MLMLTTSDNTASLWLQSLAGGGKRINEILDSAGFKNTKVNSRDSGKRSKPETLWLGPNNTKRNGIAVGKNL